MRVVPTPCGKGFQEVAGSCVSVPEFSGPTNVNPKLPNKSTSPPPELIGSAQVAVRILFHLLGQGRPRACYGKSVSYTHLDVYKRQAQEHLHLIEQGARRMGQLVDELLKLARLGLSLIHI